MLAVAKPVKGDTCELAVVSVTVAVSIIGVSVSVGIVGSIIVSGIGLACVVSIVVSSQSDEHRL